MNKRGYLTAMHSISISLGLNFACTFELDVVGYELEVLFYSGAVIGFS